MCVSVCANTAALVEVRGQHVEISSPILSVLGIELRFSG